VLGLDFETEVFDAFDPKVQRVTEIGAVLWDTERAFPLKMYNELVWSKEHTFSPRITEITGTTESDLKEFGVIPRFALNQLLAMILDSDAVVAHNGNAFDKVVLESECARHGLQMPHTPWIDTICDVPYPKKIETRKLEFLCPSHGFINPFSHRALFDVLAMLRVMSNYDFAAILKLSQEPNITVRAKTAAPFGNTAERGAKETAHAKARGYRWDGTNKIWHKNIKQSAYEDEAKACPYPVVILKNS